MGPGTDKPVDPVEVLDLLETQRRRRMLLIRGFEERVAQLYRAWLPDRDDIADALRRLAAF